MTRPLSALTVLVVLLGALLVPPTVSAVSAVAPGHTVVLTGAGTTTYPAFATGTTRYGIRTTGATGGRVQVDATTTDPGGRVFVDGELATGPVKVEGLTDGDEVSVIIRDAAGSSAYSFIYLPTGFPVLTSDATPAAQPGHTLVTLNDFTGERPRFMAVLDGNAVPRFVRRYDGNMHDFKRQPDGSYSVSSDTQDGRPVPERILELDERLERVASHRTVNLVDTDFHDSVFLPDGHKILMAYESRDDGSGLSDSVIQELDPLGDPVFTWSTRDHVDLAEERVSMSGDYAHLNSVAVLPDGDLLASFRNLTAVFKIARTAHDGYAEGEVIWRLGGRRSDFDFVGDPWGGQCAQHTATMTSKPGEAPRIMVFDNGSFNICVDQSQPDGPLRARLSSRAVEYELDEDAGTATLVWEHAPTDPSSGRPFFGEFTGSAFRMPNGNTLIGWGNNVAETTASEVDAAGRVVWTLQNPDDGAGNPVPNYGSYRFHRATVRDAFAPSAELEVPAEGATYEYDAAVVARYGCSDTGGSSLVDCSGPAESGSSLDTRTPGTHVFTVTARDGDGNTTTRSASYTVLPAPPAPTTPPTTPSPTTPSPTTPPPTLPGPRGPVADAVLVVGTDVIGESRFGAGQRGRVRLTQRRDVRVVRLRVRNAGDTTSRFDVAGPGHRRGVQVTATMGGRDVTRLLRRGLLRTARLHPDESVTLRVTLRRTADARVGDDRLLRFGAATRTDSDTVRLQVRIR
ncbi:aryl-sulfate sulfotransferase [Nocardioides sp. P5_C9_2]